MATTTITGTVTAITHPAELFLHSEMLVTVTTADAQSVEIAAPVAYAGVNKDLVVEVGQTITATGTLRKRDGRLAAKGTRDANDVLHYWTIKQTAPVAGQTITRGELAAEIAATHDIDAPAAAETVDVYADQLNAPAGDLTAEDADHIRRAVTAYQRVAGSAPLDDLSDATKVLTDARAAAEDAEQAWRQAIRAALTAGQRVADIADTAGISRPRVYQIRDGRR